MASTPRAGRKTALLCRCVHARVSPQRTIAVVTAALRAAGWKIEVLDDLCGLAARKDPRLKAFARRKRPVLLACHPRAVEWLFHAAGVPFDKRRVEVLNLRASEPADIVRTLLGPEAALPAAEGGGQEIAAPAAPKAGAWVPWFPVIDYQRCRNCKQCVGFCLFGVYAVSKEDKVEVVQPQKCKTNCPACARVCPAVAIIFPKHPGGPICGEEGFEARPGEQLRVDMKSVLKTDAYGALRKRMKGETPDAAKAR